MGERESLMQDTTPHSSTIRIITGNQVADILRGNHTAILSLITEAYISFSHRKDSLPFSSFLKFPDEPGNRIIALPAYSAQAKVAGIKWISSFPNNTSQNIDRASALMVLNSVSDGRPYSVIEASIISAQRTAASAAVAARRLVHTPDTQKSITIIGCGVINFTILSYLLKIFKNVETIHLFDQHAAAATLLASKIATLTSVRIVVAATIKEAIQASTLISFATTAPEPYLFDPTLFLDTTVILGISLRDLSSEIIEVATNIVDDIEHVNRENTSIFLTSQKSNGTEFIHSTIGSLLESNEQLGTAGITIFSPFGLGILDLTIAQYVYERAVEQNTGQEISNFIPESAIL
jgi:2,3-diaminopropionate biosynthesis protein SbnB